MRFTGHSSDRHRHNEAVSLNVRSDDGCRLWVEQSGDGPPLVLCHGGPGLWDYLDPLARLLNEHLRVIRWDQRGCGRSQRRGPYNVARFVADLDAVRDQLAGPRTALLGHSWGAHLALRYAIEHPERVSQLIYVSGTGIDPGRDWHPHYKRNLRLRLGDRLGRWETLGSRTRTPAEEREWAVLQWSADFADHDAALRHAERMATPWLGINYDCSRTINAEVKQEGWRRRATGPSDSRRDAATGARERTWQLCADPPAAVS